jgi:hypothetical protein
MNLLIYALITAGIIVVLLLVFTYIGDLRHERKELLEGYQRLELLLLNTRKKLRTVLKCGRLRFYTQAVKLPAARIKTQN